MRPTTSVPDSQEEMIEALIREAGGDPTTFDGALIAEMLGTTLRLVRDEHDTGQLKLLSRSLKEMRYAYRVFNEYAGKPKVSIFGSARTPEDHADYAAAREFSESIARRGWMAITGAGDGIMKAGHEGPQREASFGLSIRLPFETTANTVIHGDPKLINFRFFFTRKLMFMSHSDAIAVFPGGFGTMDELYEALTLMQTGKSNIVPLVLLEGRGGTYWERWESFILESLLENGWISPEDRHLFHRATDADDAVDHIERFYRVYHSSRYVHDLLVLRLRRPLAAEQVTALDGEFADLLADGTFQMRDALPEETDHRDLPRLVFRHNRRRYGRVRALIDRVNGFFDV